MAHADVDDAENYGLILNFDVEPAPSPRKRKRVRAPPRGCCFAFPRLKVLVKLRAGDALLFDPLEPHCLTEAYYEPGTSAGARLWRAPLSLFTKKAHIKWGASKTDAAAGRLEPKTDAAAGRPEPDSST
jgi:hypothetical protein